VLVRVATFVDKHAQIRSIRHNFLLVEEPAFYRNALAAHAGAMSQTEQCQGYRRHCDLGWKFSMFCLELLDHLV